MKKPASLKNRMEFFFLIALLLFAIAVVWTAWLSDDAMITLRTVMNFTHGFGPNFNLDERVQAFTHPLWFLILSAMALATDEIIIGSVILSIVISVISFWLFWEKIPSNRTGGFIAVFALLFSRSYIDFATSGLENPLSHLFIIFMLILGLECLEKKNFRLLALYFFNCSLMFLTRPDLLLAAFPLTIYICLKHKDTAQILKAFLIGAIPAAAWLFFSLFYYGYPLPNTAYAKLGTGISHLEYLNQGLYYYLYTLKNDPITLFTIGCGLIFGFKGQAFNRCIALGATLYLSYIVYIGGDFMGGRFFTVPLLLAASLIARTELRKPQLRLMLPALCLLGLYNIYAELLLADKTEEPIFFHGITNERYYYIHSNTLLLGLSWLTIPPWVDNVPKNETRPVAARCGAIGYLGLASGPGKYIIDTCALTDPLLARLPAAPNPQWRIGHFYRFIPTGYKESVAFKENLITDPEIYKLYKTIRLITRAKLLDMARIKAICIINTVGFPRDRLQDYEYFDYTAPDLHANVPIDENMRPVEQPD